MKMAKNKEKLKKILASISYSNPDIKESLRLAEKEMKKVADKLRENAEVKTFEMAKKKIAEIFKYLDVLKEELKKNENNLTDYLNQKLDILKSRMAEYRNSNLERLGVLSEEMDILKEEIREVSQRKIEIPNYENQIGQVESKLEELISNLQEKTQDKIEEILSESKKTISVLEEEIKKLRRDTMSVIASKAGGNMNRNILVGNNPSTLGRYTDLNIKAGANVTLTYTNNDNLKTTDLTIAAVTGGGVTRSINTVIVSSVVAAVTSTDYVIIAGAGIQLTLPTAVGNTNLYTIKNKVASSILVNTTGGQTIDDDSNIILATQYTAVDLISDNANWHIT